MRVRFTYRRGVEDEIRRSRGTLEELEDAADRIATAAKGFAPVRTGRLRTSIVVGTEDGNAVVRSTAPYAAYVEWGTSDTPAAHPLARGLEVATSSS